MGNLGAEPAEAVLTLNVDALGMAGVYKARHIDAATGGESPWPYEENALRTSNLPQWGIEGYVLTR